MRKAPKIKNGQNLWSYSEKSMLKFMKLNKYQWNQIAIELGRKPETVRRYWYVHREEILNIKPYTDLLKTSWSKKK